MTSKNGTRSSSTDQVQVAAAEGLITLTAPQLFSAEADASVTAVIERLFESNLVTAVAVDRAQNKIVIDYDRHARDLQGALQTFSKSLAGAPQPREISIIGELLARVPGPIRRVERRSPDVVAPPASGATASMVVIENLIVEYDAPAAAPGESGEVASASTANRLPADVTKPWVGEVVIGGVRRVVNLAAAGGCLVMSVVGVVVPGIPTVPFVLATGYFLARSSPALHDRFRRSPLFGRILSEYEDRRGLRLSSKLKVVVFTLGLMGVTVLVAGFTLPLVMLLVVVGGISFYIIGRIPTIRSDSLSKGLIPATA